MPLPPENGGKCQCQPRRSASVLSPANTQHSGCHKDEGAHGPPQGPPCINTPNDKAPYTIAHEAHLLSTLLWIFISGGLQIANSRNFPEVAEYNRCILSLAPLRVRQAAASQ